jgi:GrpB-like predicted nucleotidyltransferase (UPF0157 family)
MKKPPGVHVVDYNPRWPELFRTESAMLLGLASNPIIDIEHFGSTAVPGLRAKPIVDIMASVRNLDDADEFAPHLEAIGYELVQFRFRNRRFYAKALGAEAGYQLHLVPLTAWPHKNELLFRDWLRTHADVAAAYAQLKTELAQRFSSDRRAYTDAKAAFVQAVVNDARRAQGLPQETVWEE